MTRSDAGTSTSGGGSASDRNTYTTGDAGKRFGARTSDTIYGDIGDDSIFGGLGNDTIYALQGSDFTRRWSTS